MENINCKSGDFSLPCLTTREYVWKPLWLTDPEESGGFWIVFLYVYIMPNLPMGLFMFHSHMLVRRCEVHFLSLWQKVHSSHTQNAKITFFHVFSILGWQKSQNCMWKNSRFPWPNCMAGHLGISLVRPKAHGRSSKMGMEQGSCWCCWWVRICKNAEICLENTGQRPSCPSVPGTSFF